jgi:pimeloyl-ACP methyl ester carboxylesterase
MQAEVLLKHTQFTTSDKLELPALLYTPQQPTKKAAIFLHGNGSASVFYKAEKMLAFAQGLAQKNWAFFAFNNRGAHYIKKFRFEDDGEKKERFLGTALELIDECVLDIDGAIEYLMSQGFSEFVLIGESTGANKICVYNHHKPNNSCLGYALVAGGDDTGMWYEMLGKEKFWNSVHLAQKKIAEGKGEELIAREISHGIMTHQALLDTIDPDGSYNCFPFVEASGKAQLSKEPLFRFFAEITKPSLVLYGEKDLFCFVPPAQAISILKEHTVSPENFTWEVTPGADHSFSEHTQQEVTAITSWISKLA